MEMFLFCFSSQRAKLSTVCHPNRRGHFTSLYFDIIINYFHELIRHCLFKSCYFRIGLSFCC